MIELNEAEIIAKAELYAASKQAYFKPFERVYYEARKNSWIDGCAAGLLAYNDKMRPFTEEQFDKYGE